MKTADKNCFRSQGGCVIDMDKTLRTGRARKGAAIHAGPMQVEAAPPNIISQPASAHNCQNDFFYD